jgi:flagellar biosynthetic protein FliP
MSHRDPMSFDDLAEALTPGSAAARRRRLMRRLRDTVRATLVVAVVGCVLLAGGQAVRAQSSSNTSDAVPAARTAEPFDPTNPVSILSNASNALPLLQGAAQNGNAEGDTPAADRPFASGMSTTLSILLLLTVLSIAPSIVIMCTSFTRISVVLALLRQALGTQSLPPGQVVSGLALFMTLLIMAPTFDRVYNEALVPLQNDQINEMEAWARAKQPLKDFMFDQIEYADSWSNVYMILNYRYGPEYTADPSKLTRGDVDMLTLIPAFMLSELKVAFLIGFRLYLPFLVIDMVISSVLISMGMLMLPPVLISLPFKLLLFVLVDGWMLVAGNLFNSFAVPGVTI